ncbi:MAG: hypothetical protein AMJ95_07530 [Omnitrophica WOR_2 bacterium SM23_72]|nr:MAG: hypothetical protein AMJ95_07530 [Omnitrophica WOR_2 bacterium SM23_72]
MSGYYIYFICSLPMLHFGAKPSMGVERFIQLASELLSQEDVRILKACTQKNIYEHKMEQPTLNKWLTFDTALRNELVKVRSSRKKTDPAKYLRQDGYTEPAISHLALNAYRSPSILEGERMLDMERWRFLEGLSLGHYFDLDFLIVYTLKLLMLERWEKIRTADKEQLLEEAIKT